MKRQGGIRKISTVLVFLFYHYAYCGPVIRPSRMVREIYPEVEQEIPDSTQQACIVGDITYPPSSPIPSSNPCLQCSCVSGLVQCSTRSCTGQQEQQCSAVQDSAAQCCTVHTCACAHQGRVYAHGQRLPQSRGAECSVCYCRAGHVQCAEVGCYTRSDCEPRYVKGECCPKYDHCPPRDPLSDRIIITSPSSISIQNPEQDLISTLSSNNSASSTLGFNLPDEGSGDDDVTLSDEPKRSSTPITFSIKEIESKGNKRHEENIQIHRADKPPQTSSLNPQITIQEVIPPRSEFIPHKSVSLSPQNPATYRVQDSVLPTASSVQLLTSSNELTDSETNGSEKSEVYDRPPPVLRIGDQLLFIKQGQLVPEKDASTPSPVITLIGAEGLQIGLVSEEIIDHDILPTNPQVSTSDTNINTQKTTDLNESDEIITSSDEATTETVTNLPNNLSSTTIDEQSEYIPEENPYYPPIPEDIMNLTQDETTSTENNLSVVPLKNKILPTILGLRNNETKHMNMNSTQQWLKNDETSTQQSKNEETKEVNSTQQSKNEPTKISIPLLNEKAVIPDSILDLVAASDLVDDEKLDKIMAGPTETTVDKSKETLELNEELFDSIEFTSIPPVHGSLISSEDASVELIQNDSSAIDTSDLVETIPGFEVTTQIITEQQIKTVDGPKSEVEMININKEQVQVKDFHEEIQKRDVVKKVLKETFENPKENIKIDELEPENVSVEVIGLNEEQNIVKPNFVVQNSTKIILNSTISRQYNSKITD